MRGWEGRGRIAFQFFFEEVPTVKKKNKIKQKTLNDWFGVDLLTASVVISFRGQAWKNVSKCMGKIKV